VTAIDETRGDDGGSVMTHQLDLPEPTRSRWQPLRAGLVDIFYYDSEEFHFHDGRLLLRGNNGTGKSKVLALTLPFLLDGELTPSRVEPDGDRNKRMEWNLLLGGKHPNDERTGYAWLEFGRVDEEGTRHFRTIGCGLKAVKGRGVAKHWFFSTTERIGPRFALLSATRVPLTRERLRDELAGRGHVYDTATEYRRAVDEHLFGLGKERYEALVGLLIQLRQPQLSKKPDERLLSHALTEALPPLDAALVSDVAEAFRGLDDERLALRALTEASEAATAFLGHYRRYARVAAKRQAAVLRLAHSKYEHLNRDLTEADAAHDAARIRLSAAEQRLEALDADRVRLTATREALNRSPEMDAARELEQARKAAVTLASLANARASDAAAAHDQARGWADRAAAATAAAQADASQLASVEADTAAAADQSGIDHSAVRLALADGEPPHIEARRAGEQQAERRASAIVGLESLLAAAERAHGQARVDRTEASRVAASLAQAREAAAEAAAEQVRAGAELVSSYRRWLDAATELRLADADTSLELLETWTDTLDGPNPAAAAITTTHQIVSTDLTRAETELDAEHAAVTAERDALDAETARLEAGGHDAPPATHTRDHRLRADRPGAPLWRAVDFVDAVDADGRAGIEAALEASGLLDAWLSPDGSLRAADTGDALALPGDPAPDDGLAAVLRPALDRDDPQAAALPDEIVSAVLTAIGLGESGHTTWVAADGNFRIGALRGMWRKESARYIGEGSREAARRARLSELAASRADVQRRLDRIDEDRARIRARAATLATELAARPSDDPLRAAHLRLGERHDAVRKLAAESEEASGKAAAARLRAEQADAEAADYARDTNLPTDRGELAAVREAVADYRAALGALLPAVTAAARSAGQQRDAATEAERALIRHAEAREAAADARREADGAAERQRVLTETLGADVDELYRRLAATDAAMAQRDQDEKTARAEHSHALADRSRIEGRRDQIRDDIDAALGDRDHAVTALRSFARTGLLAVALPELDQPPHDETWAPTRAVALARQVNQDLDTVDDGERAWELTQQRVSAEHKVLTDALARHGHSVGMSLRDGVMVVDVLFQGHSRDVPGLATALVDEVARRGRLLSAKERELLENHLVGEVAGALQELIASAEAQVLAMNQDLERRPTSTGMALRLRWRPARDAPDGLEAVRHRLLRQSSDAWSPADRAQVGEFLQARIAADRDERPGDSWHDQLSRALDYRGWHEFAIQRRQDGQWRPATGPASGGERVLAASVPLFAAASAHYSSGSPHAPRLIALDEAFAGVDDDSRAKCLGLLAAFDLDVVMTSEREWACYATVPGIGIAQLARREGVDAVLVTPWRWNGRERVRLPRPVPFVPAAAETRPRQPDGSDATEPLFGEL
jgi:uncharacterized protein (TIGR02680 family)